MIRIVVRSTAGFLVAALLSFPLDWMVWRVRVSAGGGMGRVSVRQVTVAALKGNRDEYYIDGAVEVECSRSLFPQAGAGACWWLRSHGEMVTEN